MLRDIAMPDTALSRVRLAIQWIRNNFRVQLRVERLAEMAAMSTSAFHRHFKVATAMSPLQFQKQIRLLQARMLLIAGAPTASSVAFDVGYESASQFSREYARFFGLPPASDVLAVQRHIGGR
jgi:transcriptional regulator GlxA family with amidase domain